MKQTDARIKRPETSAGGALDWRSQPRRIYTVEQKRAIVAECLQSGASLSSIALKHSLNANMVRKWVVREEAGTLDVKRGRKPTMLPVVMADAMDDIDENGVAGRRDVQVEIETSRGVMRVSGEVDARMMEALITAMLR